MSRKIQLNISEKAIEEVDWLKPFYENNKTRVIHQGIAALNVLVKAQTEGGRIILEDKKGEQSLMHLILDDK